mgnify:CR=1 FL=1
MPSECDQCQWKGTGGDLPECGQATCDKGERIWMSAYHGLLRIDPATDSVTEEPCSHHLPTRQEPLVVRLNISITSRFRVVQNALNRGTVDLFLDFGESYESHHYLGWINEITTSKSLLNFDPSIIEQARRLFLDLPPEAREELQPLTRFERIIQGDE